MRRLWIILPLAMLLVAGCKDPYGASAKAGADIATGITAGLKTVSQLQAAGTISRAEAVNVAGYLEFANKGDEAFLTCVSTAHTNGNTPGSYTACVQAFNSTLNTPSQLVLIKVANAGASQTISTIVNGLTAAVAAIQAGLGGA